MRFCADTTYMTGHVREKYWCGSEVKVVKYVEQTNKQTNKQTN
jgi:hypothetical protein